MSACNRGYEMAIKHKITNDMLKRRRNKITLPEDYSLVYLKKTNKSDVFMLIEGEEIPILQITVTNGVDTLPDSDRILSQHAIEYTPIKRKNRFDYNNSDDENGEKDDRFGQSCTISGGSSRKRLGKFRKSRRKTRRNRKTRRSI